MGSCAASEHATQSTQSVRRADILYTARSDGNSFAQQDCEYIVAQQDITTLTLATSINKEINAQKTFLDI